MLNEQTLSYLSDLKLYGMKQAFQWQLEQSHSYDLCFEERLGLMIDHERSYRENKKIERLLSASKLKQKAFIEDIDYRHPRGLKKEEMGSLISCQWVKESFNLFITGPTGIGKSWLACALGHQACRLGFSVYYIRLTRLLDELKLARVDGSYMKTLAKYLKIDLLILDDWGLERLSQEQRRDVLELIDDRHMAKSLLITSQLPRHTWHEIIGDPTVADSILDRLFNKYYKLELAGDSLRKEQKSVAS